MSWRDKLSHVIFGEHLSEKSLESGVDVKSQSLAPYEPEKEASQQAAVQDLPTLSNDEPAGFINSVKEMQPNSAISIPAKASSNEVVSLDHITGDSEGGDIRLDEKGVSMSPASTSKKKNLAAILSSFVPATSTTGADRNAAIRPPLRAKRSDNLEAPSDKVASGSGSSNSSDGGRSPSLGNSIKSLHERHKLHREAGEAFKNMKIDDGLENRRLSTEGLPRNKRASIEGKPGHTSPTLRPADIPDEILRGEAMLKVTTKKVMQRVLRLDSDRGQILWDSKKNNKVNLEAIREVRTNEAAASYRNSMSISASHEPYWISIIYQTEGVYKALHLIALSDESFTRWKDTLSAVQDERKMFMSGADLLNQKQQLWLRQHWKAADSSENSKLEFDEVTKLCRRLGILSNGRDLSNRFKEADSQRKGYLNFEDFQRFVSMLKRRIDLEILFLHWADIGSIGEVAWTSDKSIDSEDIRELLQQRVSQAFMTSARLADFLNQEQRIRPGSNDAVKSIIEKYSQGKSDGNMGYAGFSTFLQSGDNAILADQSSLVSTTATKTSRIRRETAETAEELIALSSQERTTQDMNRPLSDYFISSSHNTYLVGGQWKGDSTVEGYIRALLQGARSVEIDCWDGPNGEPQVTHGRTLTTKVSFREVITAIERYAFIASPFPLILSLEVHNDLAQQDALADILRTILKDKLLSEPLQGIKPDQLPTPVQLKGKILVKAKNLLVVDANLAAISNNNEETLPVLVAEKRTNTSTTDTTESESGDHLLHSARDLVRSVTKRSRSSQRSESDGKSSTKKILISPNLASLLIYTVGVKHRGINKKEHYAVEHMISLSERSGLKYLKSEMTCEDLVKHNRSHLTRVYPSMSSFKRLSQSANFIPNLFWSMGCQLVAMNWQTLDIGYEMNQAMFARNAKSGYVLKPEALRVKDGMKGNFGKRKVQVQIKLQIISAQQLPRFRDATRDKESDHDDVIDPFVSACIIVPQNRDYDVKGVKSAKKKRQSGMQSLLSEMGVKQRIEDANSTAPSIETSTSKKEQHNWLSRQRTSVVRANGFNPIWNETLSFLVSLSVNSSARLESNHTPTIEEIQEQTKGLLDVCFVRFEVGEEVKSLTHTSGDTPLDGKTSPKDRAKEIKDEDSDEDLKSLDSLGEDTNCLATYMISLGSLQQGYRHVPLYDAQLSQYLFSTLFIKTEMSIV